MRRLLPIVLTLAFTCVGAGPVLAADDGFEHGLSAGGEVTTREIGDGSLTTLFASNNGFAGNSFDLTAAVNLSVVGWDMNLDTGTWNVEIYYRMGTANGYEQNPGAWTLLGTELVVGAGVDLPTHVDIGGLTLAAGDLVGIVTRVQEYSAFNYTNGGPNNYSNNDLTITSYAGLGDGWPPGSVFAGRIWNGTVHYDYGVTPVESATWGSIKALF